MPRKLAAYRLAADPAWYRAIREAWNALDEHGQKKKVYEAAGMTRSTANRISLAKDGEVSFDTLEALRLAINKERKAEIVPPAFTPVVSSEHYKACVAAAEMARRDRLAKLALWISLGEKLDERGGLDAMIEAIEHRLKALAALDQSDDEVASVQMQGEIVRARR